MPPETKIPNNTEIDQALKEFEVQYGTQQAQQADQIPKADDSDLPKMVQLVIKYSGGTIKDQRTAEHVLLGFVIVAIGISLFLFFGRGRSKTEVKAPLGQEIVYPEDAPPRLENKF